MQLRLSGEMAEWSNAAVLKTVVPKGTGGSNPSLSATFVQDKMASFEGLKYPFSLLRSSGVVALLYGPIRRIINDL